MTGFREHVFKDGDGAQVRIGESADHPHAAFVDPGRDGDLGFHVPAHRLAEFTRALYAAAGQPVPDLPVIWHPQLVSELARDLLYAVEGTSGGPGAARYEQKACALLALGWRKP